MTTGNREAGCFLEGGVPRSGGMRHVRERRDKRGPYGNSTPSPDRGLKGEALVNKRDVSAKRRLAGLANGQYLGGLAGAWALLRRLTSAEKPDRASGGPLTVLLGRPVHDAPPDRGHEQFQE